jgi:hypothetical protein
LVPLGVVFESVVLLPAALYILLLLWQYLGLARTGGLIASLAALPLIVLTHILYGLGFWRGLLLTRFKRPSQGPPSNVVLEPIAR